MKSNCTEQCKPFENIMQQVKVLNPLDHQTSLKIWFKVVMNAPVHELVTNSHIAAEGFDLVKLMIEKLWQACIISSSRYQEHKKLARRQHQMQMQASSQEDTEMVDCSQSQPCSLAEGLDASNPNKNDYSLYC